MSIKVAEIVTQRIIAALESGTASWRRPWVGGDCAPRNIDSPKTPYRGSNFFFLSMMNHPSPYYLTFKQIVKKGGRIKEGEEKKYTPIIFWSVFDKKDAKGNVLEDKGFSLRFYNVWNLSQIDGIEAPKRDNDVEHTFTPVDAAEAIVKGYEGAPQVITVKGGDRACYEPVIDTVMMPSAPQFACSDEYYSTLFHEFAHSTGHRSRLNRPEIQDYVGFGSHSYSKEELVAEMTAAFLCAESGIDNSTIDNSAAYIASWLKALKNDPKMIIEAASKAQKAADHILGRKPDYAKKEEN